MLVLSRHKDESIMVGDNIEIIVVDIQRNKIQIGIRAPKRVPVYRKELYGRICDEKAGRRAAEHFLHSISSAAIGS
ncbi:MAG: carbon storage regulator CsrA [Sedimentisphaerales bacterium]|nr:carbon storage regulator CsrA [Sedimentisphaerales bacterium]